MINTPKHILISRTDSIGDVVLTLPMAAALKQCFPQVRISFLGRRYTQPVVEACPAVDTFIEREAFLRGNPEGLGTVDTIIHVFPDPEIAARAKSLRIPMRIGTRNRAYHWWTCNKLVELSRKNSDLHETQLNLKLLKPLGCKTAYSMNECVHLLHLQAVASLPVEMEALLPADKKTVILHPKSQGNGREWPEAHFVELAQTLSQKGMQVFVSGTAAEQEKLSNLLPQIAPYATDITGKMELDEFITFISRCDALVASGTGPLHIAAGLGKVAIGLFPPLKPIHPGRWRPLGIHAVALAASTPCEWCRKAPQSCTCMEKITVTHVAEEVLAGLARIV